MIVYLDEIFKHWYIVFAAVVFCISNFGYFIFNVYDFKDEDLQLTLVLLCARLQIVAIALLVLGLCKIFINGFIFYLICIAVVLITIYLVFFTNVEKNDFTKK